MDNLKPEFRKKNMQNIHSKDTNIELKVRSALHKKGFRYRKNVKYLIGKPDIIFKNNKTVIFIDSCFWHKCQYHYVQPKSRLEYWIPKIERNVKRAREVNKQLKSEGWLVIRIWEHSIKKDFEKCMASLIKKIRARS
jgi:DNA mismatch endonuclease (patch repair protein)